MGFSSEKDQEEKGHFTQSLEAIWGDKRTRIRFPSACLPALLSPWKLCPWIEHQPSRTVYLYIPLSYRRFYSFNPFWLLRLSSNKPEKVLLFHLFVNAFLFTLYIITIADILLSLSFLSLSSIHLFSVSLHVYLASHTYLPASLSTCLPLTAQAHFCQTTTSHCARCLSSVLLSW